MGPWLLGSPADGDDGDDGVWGLWCSRLDHTLSEYMFPTESRLCIMLTGFPVSITRGRL